MSEYIALKKSCPLKREISSIDKQIIRINLWRRKLSFLFFVYLHFLPPFPLLHFPSSLSSLSPSLTLSPLLKLFLKYIFSIVFLTVVTNLHAWQLITISATCTRTTIPAAIIYSVNKGKFSFCEKKMATRGTTDMLFPISSCYIFDDLKVCIFLLHIKCNTADAKEVLWFKVLECQEWNRGEAFIQ